MASKKVGWAKFPHEAKAYDYGGDKLHKAWASLHAGDCEPFPDDKRAGPRTPGRPPAGRGSPRPHTR